MVGFENTVVYKNEMNTVPLTGFTPVEIDLLFTILAKIKNKRSNRIVLSFKNLKEIINYTRSNSIKVFAEQLDSTYRKLIALNIKVGNEKRWIRFVLFTEYDIDLESQTVGIKVNERFVFLINKLVGNFTKFELEELLRLSSSYSKNMYRLLKQWRSTGYAVYEIEEFKRLLGVPDYYSMGNITQSVLAPIEKELKPYFKRFKIKKIKGVGKNSRKVIKLQFTFTPDEIKRINELDDIDFDREYFKKELMELPLEVAQNAEPVIGVYRADLDIVGVFEPDGSFTVFGNQDSIAWRLKKTND